MSDKIDWDMALIDVHLKLGWAHSDQLEAGMTKESEALTEFSRFIREERKQWNRDSNVTAFTKAELAGIRDRMMADIDAAYQRFVTAVQGTDDND